MSPRRVLFVQHASVLGGSCVSLMLTARGLDPARYHPIIALARPTPAVESYYRSVGLETVAWPGIACWNHTTAIQGALERARAWNEVARLAVSGWRAAGRRTVELVEAVRPDLVHLNSVVLAPSAHALARAAVPVVWHVREHPVRGGAGIRTALLRRLLSTCPSKVIFISRADRRAWLRSDRGEVLYNFVEPNAATVTPQESRQRLGIEAEAPVVAFVGGFNRLKGIWTLLEALERLKPEFPNLRCLAPGSVYPTSSSLSLRLSRKVLPLVGYGTTVQRVEQRIEASALRDVIVRMPFAETVGPLLAASDLLVFPATAPHFARPVIEAASLAVPAVASRLDGIEELIAHDDTGLLVPPLDAGALADAMRRLLRDRALRERMGRRAAAVAMERFSAHRACKALMSIYDDVLGPVSEQTVG